jgi:hypothetical protein
MGVNPIQLAVFRCPLIAVGLLYLEGVWSSIPVAISSKMVSSVILPHFVAAVLAISTSIFADAA